MTPQQIEDLQQAIRREVMAAVFEAELQMDRGLRGRKSVREIEAHIEHMRQEAKFLFHGALK